MTLGILALACVFTVFGLAAAAFCIAGRRPTERPRFGRRGRNRARALRRHLWFRVLEPPLRFVASGVEPWLPQRALDRVERALAEAGYPFGLTQAELVAVTVIISASFAGAILGFDSNGPPSALVLVGTMAVASAPFMRVSAAATRRGRRITRRLPSVLELVVMCMSAGLDLPRALRLVVESATDPTEPVIEEIEAVVREMELGRTRREALRSFAERVPTAEVCELVNTVVQSEDKGISLSRTLAIQSRTLKLRRSLNAERAASGAALMMVGPMALIFLCVIALLLGPVLIRTTSGGLGA